MSRKASRSTGTKATPARSAMSVADVGGARVDASAILTVALRAATTTRGGLSDGGMFDNIADKAPAASIGARKAKPPANGC